MQERLWRWLVQNVVGIQPAAARGACRMLRRIMRLDPMADVGETCRDFEMGFGGVLVGRTTFCLQVRQSRDMGSPFAALGSDLGEVGTSSPSESHSGMLVHSE